MTTSRFAWGTLALTVAVIAWGAFVRASGSGAGCGAHWPLCNGEVIPRPEAVETAIELTHRASSGLALLAVVALALLVFRRSSPGAPQRRAAAAAVVLMVTEAAIGAGLVLLELVADNASAARAYWMAGHLLNTFLLLAALAATAWWTGPGAGPARASVPPSAKLAAGAMLALVLLVGASGGVAALGDTLYPVSSLGEGIRQDFAPGSALLVRLRALHPLLALIVGTILVVAVPVVGRRAGGRLTGPLVRAVVLLVVAQIGAGVVNLLLLAPIWMQILHLVLADALWVSLVLFALSLAAPVRGTPVARKGRLDGVPAVGAR
ncbi:MAG TPA: COX15/CtaA family protein [Longimicrobiales bacterium]|nr:COX15/CtaA family protein [Longimicrobiales bacterium]